MTSAFQVSGSSAPAPTTIVGLLAAAMSSASSATAAGSAPRARTTRPGAARGSAGLASADQSSMGTITRAGPLAVAASWWARAIAPGDVLRANGLVDPHRVLAREPAQLAREERLGREVAAVLLADDDDEGRAVDACGGQRADGVPEPRGRVQDRERGLAAPDRPARRHAHHGALVEPEHEAEVAREVGEERDLRRPWIREQRGQPVLAEDVERRVADRLRSHARSLYANDLIFQPRGRDDGRREGDDRWRSGRRRRVHRVQPRAAARRARARPRRREAGDDHLARDGPGAGARAVARLHGAGRRHGRRSRRRRRRAAVGDPDHRRHAPDRVPRRETRGSPTSSPTGSRQAGTARSSSSRTPSTRS